MFKSGSRFRLTDRRLITLAVEIVLLFALAYLIARLVFFIGFGASSGDYQIDSAGSGARSAQSGALSPQIAQADFSTLFADRRVEVQDEAPVAALPDTQLELVLRGIRRGTEPTNGAALIQGASALQVFVSVGEEISDGVELREVHVDYVIISRRGIREVLRIREASERQATDDAAGAEASGGAGAQPSAAPAVYSASQIARASARPGERLDVAGMFVVEPRYIDGALVGMAFVDGNTALLQSIGLRMNDILIEIDGRSVGSVDQIEALLDDLRGNDTVDVSIVRSGFGLTFSVDLP